MVFSTSLFLTIFLPLFLIIYSLVGTKLKNWVILLFSIIFYAWGAPVFVFVLIGSSILTYYMVQQLHKAKKTNLRKLYLVLSIGINLGLLIYFKYANFFIENANNALLFMGISTVNWIKIALPIGISFYTFQSLTYAVDVYRKVHKPLNSASNYLLYIISFPQMIAGPIVRFNTIADQIIKRDENLDDKLLGFIRFSIGLAKKVLIANVMGEQADLIMNSNISGISTLEAWTGILAYTFQIYFDFSGYSDMAIGLGKMMGFKFPENFNNPYISQSITEFWRRWHITLGAWMRDYLYIPLGGNKVSTKRRLYFNLWFVFLISGLWHGASWSFVFWGAYHGFFLIAERLYLLRVYKVIGKIPSIIITFTIVIIGWVFFRLEDFNNGLEYLSKMFSFNNTASNINTLPSFWIIFSIAVLFSFSNITRTGQKIGIFFFEKDKYNGINLVFLLVISILLFAISLSFITASGFNPFIYYRF